MHWTEYLAHCGDYVHVAIEHADLIIMVGHDVVEKPPFFMHPKDTRKVRPLSCLYPKQPEGLGCG